MLYPTNVQSTNCKTVIDNILISKSDDSSVSSITELTKGTFYSNPDYNKIYKNFNYEKSYDAWIYEGNERDKIVGYKIFQSYPYDIVEFNIGDYIHWNFNHVELSTWLLTSLDTQYLYNVTGRMLLCNNSLRWKNNDGNLNCYPCVIKDAMTYTNFKWGNDGLVEQGADIVVLVQRNEQTSTITVNDRFIFSGVAFKVKQKFNELNPNYLELYMQKSPELSMDNINENIAVNSSHEPNIDYDGIVLSPQVNEILKNSLQTFTVYNYVNGIKQNDKFNIIASGVPSDKYVLTIINENEFSIQNISPYNINPLLITCVDIENQNVLKVNIWLGGGW